ncbi:MAG: hypothetical protein LLG01_17650 [Planctomycetaceae bacterium]|nr:hypothetical protein [Planctomycetaceae bacterium]
MKILGLHANTHESGCAIIIDGRLVHASSQERYDRAKMSGAAPVEAIDAALADCGISAADIDWLAVSDDLGAEGYSRSGSAHKRQMLKETWPDARRYFRGRPLQLWKYYESHRFSHGTRTGLRRASHVEAAKKHLQAKGFRGKTGSWEHGYCHAATAYYCSGFDRCLVFVNEGSSFINSCSVYLAGQGKLEKILDVPTTHSPGMFYSTITQLLGFKPNRHEGKITGLAALGDPTVLGGLARSLFHLRSDRDDFYSSPLLYLWWRDYHTSKRGRPLPPELREHKIADMAAAWQLALEEALVALTERYLQRYPDIRKVALAGGVHGNVKLNQRINALAGVEEIYVHPGMSDCGQPVGAALACWADSDGPVQPFRHDNVYLGPGICPDEIDRLSREYQLVFEDTPDVTGVVAELLAQKKVVGICRGRMEYGPRALGNRSILYTPTDPAVNDWLNKQLGRTEFMPFAPVTLREHADQCYLDADKSAYTAAYMTVCYDCTEWMKQTQPAVVHVDGTARPQYISRNQNPFYYDVIDKFRRRTGLPSVVNTSFNMHEEPIVRTAWDALRAFVASNLDALVLEDRLILRDKNESLRAKLKGTWASDEGKWIESEVPGT